MSMPQLMIRFVAHFGGSTVRLKDSILSVRSDPLDPVTDHPWLGLISVVSGGFGFDDSGIIDS